MGGTQSSLTRIVPTQHKQKVDPLLRANHKHSIHLASPPHTKHTLSPVSQILAAACLLEIQPPSILFDIWDKVTQTTVDVTDSTSEIVEDDYLSPSTLGNPDESTRYIDFFDDELVRHLYDYKKLVRRYLAVPQVVDGLISSSSSGGGGDGGASTTAWGVRQLAFGLQLESKEMCTEALGYALSFYKPLELDIAREEGTAAATAITSEAELISARDKLTEALLSRESVTVEMVDEAIVLASIAVVFSYAPKLHFERLWTYQSIRLQEMIDGKATASAEQSSGSDEDWGKCAEWLAEHEPEKLPRLFVLKDHPKHGYSVARQLFFNGASR